MLGHKLSKCPGTYIINFRSGQQIKKDTNYRRNVQRVVWEFRESPAEGRRGAGTQSLQGYAYGEAQQLENAYNLLAQGNNSVDLEELSKLLAMGFEESKARRALEAYNGNTNRACEALLNDQVPAAGGDGGGMRSMAQVKVKGDDRSVVFYSDGSMKQQGPLNQRDVRRLPPATWQVLADPPLGWVNYDSEDSSKLEDAYAGTDGQVRLSGHTVDLHNMIRVRDNLPCGTVVRWVLPKDRKEFAAARRHGRAAEGIWMWQEDDVSWVPYSDGVCAALNLKCRMDVTKGGTTYRVDLQAMVQTNVATSFPRNQRSVLWERAGGGRGGWSRYPRAEMKLLEEAFLCGPQHVMFPGGKLEADVVNKRVTDVQSKSSFSLRRTCTPHEHVEGGDEVMCVSLPLTPAISLSHYLFHSTTLNRSHSLPHPHSPGLPPCIASVHA